jgi:hypothetical protein
LCERIELRRIRPLFRNSGDIIKGRSVPIAHWDEMGHWD